MTEMHYRDNQGNALTRDEIAQAVKERRAVLVWSHGNWVNIARLAVYPTHDDAAIAYDKYETVGQCYSMADETWTRWPNTADALKAAAGALRYS